MQHSFTVFPAIDLRGGTVVRLREGDPRQLTRYDPDPAAAARRWIDAGARWLHVVNLDGAFGDTFTTAHPNLRALEQILAAAIPAGVQVQFGGGLRDLDAIQAVIEMGASRAILGTVVVEQPQILEEALRRWGAEAVGASLDAREGLVRVRGWQSPTDLPAQALANDLAGRGLRWLVFTDIARDGLQTGANLPATVTLAGESGLKVIASGGVSRLEEVAQAREARLAGCIVGRALYEGNIDPTALFALDGGASASSMGRGAA